ncbi:E3 ubiquitin-protein ligase TRIM39-like [Platysternon megacephalum]|uniref:E3 ubiquitin-protein ligase TRIM39-like n=1 Tax=Platysternon megacephalum TaxID=55544 RepID=A0A4D9DSB5_9SAUR|nr:E3 ubiquitin-protein ligase TRIM39-like [Platysternon megacephalum]
MERQLTALSVILSIQFYWGSCQVEVHQDTSVVTLEGQSSRIFCRYQALVLSSLHWFREPPGQSPASLLMPYQDENIAQGGNFTAQLFPDKKLSYLHISNSTLGDAASSFCAVETQ